MNVRYGLGLAITLTFALQYGTATAAPPSFDTLGENYAKDVLPLVKTYCFECHSTDVAEADLDLEKFTRIDAMRREVKAWQRVSEQLLSGEMPPKDAKPIPPADRARIRSWVDNFLHAEAAATSGDPGPVVLRRLSNAEYTYTVRDLTGLDLQPAKEFPADSAAGEGFTNTGNALVMSPALLSKYLDAGKGIAAHAMLIPNGFRFTQGVSRRDWTDESLQKIRAFYAQFADAEGRLPLEPYLRATLEERDALRSGATTVESVAQRRQLNARYLSLLWLTLNDAKASLLLAGLRDQWAQAKPQDVAALIGRIASWQRALNAFQSVGHMKSWVVSVTPLAPRRELRYKFPDVSAAAPLTFQLVSAGVDKDADVDSVVWRQPRLVIPGRPDVPLRDVRSLASTLVARRDKLFASTAACLAAVEDVSSSNDAKPRASVAQKHGVDVESLNAWLDYLGIGTNAPPVLDHFRERLPRVSGYEFVTGWGSPETPNLVANSSNMEVRVPGRLRGHGFAMHPSPTLAIAVGWSSPLEASIRIDGIVTHAHPECGNGVTWSLERRRGATRQRLAAGVAAGPKPVSIGPIEHLPVQRGDLISVILGPRDGNHACDLTDVALTVKSESAGEPKVWDLCGDVTSDVMAGNPHADRLGNPAVWHFYKEPVQGGVQGPVIPSGSLLALWLASSDRAQKQKLADSLQTLLVKGPSVAKNDVDRQLQRQLASLGGPLFSASLRAPSGGTAKGSSAADIWGLDASLFGKARGNASVGAADLVRPATSVTSFSLPADLVAGAELVSTVELAPGSRAEASVQADWGPAPGLLKSGIEPTLPILVVDQSAARTRFEAAFADFRRVFPAALCYTKIVPVDEVVTLTLFHREDDALARLMLDENQKSAIDRLWSELHFVSQDALTLVDAFAQLMEYATQDSNPKLFEPFRKPIHDRAAAYRKELIDAEPKQIDAVIAFASSVYRRPLRSDETNQLRSLYRALRAEELTHDEAIRLLLARLFVAPEFLYRLESPGAGPGARPVNEWELASRLSYFLWSSMPDAELRGVAEAGRLHEPAVLIAQSRRMLKDPKVRRLSTEFACQWLHVYDFDTLDEKSERHFPTFTSMRAPIYEETIRFFTELFQTDAPIASIYEADFTFLNEDLARHYSIPDVKGAEWRRVEGVRRFGRGGILGFASTLAKQSGASRTSPILRGNWVSEVLLGEKLPRPPKNVPRLPEDEAEGSLTVRQQVERHSSDPKCYGCHRRIDAIGFALEGYDAIGRLRQKDAAGRAVETKAKHMDGTEFDGMEGLRNYLLTARRDTVFRQFHRKLLGYALGRSVQLSDEALLQQMQEITRKPGARIQELFEAIVTSRQFQQIRGREDVATDH